MDRASRRRQSKDDKKALFYGLDPIAQREPQLAALARELYNSINEARKIGSVTPILCCLYAYIDKTVLSMKDVPIACGKGCSHCCYVWVSASAPEVLYIINKLNNDVKTRIIETNQATCKYSFDQRDKHPTQCPFLCNNICSIYQLRPQACRLAASGDATVCARSYHNETDEGIPTPYVYLMSRTGYTLAMVAALEKAGLPSNSYELNSALAKALETPDAERRWLSGEDIFDGIHKDPGKISKLIPPGVFPES